MATRSDVEIIELPVGADPAVRPWPVYWSAVWVGALASIAMALLFGLVAVAFGAHAANGRLGPEDLGVGDLVAAVAGAFFAFVVGGWTASRIAGLRRAESAALHGAITWLVSVPLLLVLIALGAGSLFGVWYTGLAGTPVWAAAPPATGPEAAKLAREAAGGAVTALFLGLVGAVLGGWFASGEPMRFSHYRRRDGFTSPAAAA